MDVRIIFQGVRESPWMQSYLESKIEKLDRYVPVNSEVTIFLSEIEAEIKIKTPKHQYSFSSQGSDLFETFSRVFEAAAKFLRNEHAKLKVRIHRKFTEAEGFLL